MSNNPFDPMHDSPLLDLLTRLNDEENEDERRNQNDAERDHAAGKTFAHHLFSN